MTENDSQEPNISKHQRLSSKLQTLGYGEFQISEDSIPLVEKLLSDLIFYKRKIEFLTTKENIRVDDQDRTAAVSRSGPKENSDIEEQSVYKDYNNIGDHDHLSRSDTVKTEIKAHDTKLGANGTEDSLNTDTHCGSDVQKDVIESDEDYGNIEIIKRRKAQTAEIKSRKFTDWKTRSTLKRKISSSSKQNIASSPSEAKSFRCNNCSRVFKTSAALEKHEVKIHDIQTESSQSGHQKENIQEKDFILAEGCEAGVELTNTEERLIPKKDEKKVCVSSYDFEEANLETYSDDDEDSTSNCEISMETSENDVNETAENQSNSVKLKRGRPKRNGVKTEFPCKDCEAVFEASWKLNVHRHRVHKIKPTECDLCGKQYRNERDMRRHKAYAHVRAKEITCQKCGKRFKNKICLKNHLKLHNKKLEFKCELCPKSFSTKYILEKHVIKTHENNDVNVYAKYTCHICGKTFEHNSYLTVHIDSVHAKLRPYVCEVCGKTFPTQCYLAYHKRRLHSDDVNLNLYKCNICPKTYRHRSSLSHHEKLHQKQHAYVCHICGQEFTQKCSLDRHDLIIHKGIKPFVCLICNDRFRDSFTVQSHLIGSHNIPKQQTKKSNNLWDKQLE